jgi:hypothetical protein
VEKHGAKRYGVVLLYDGVMVFDAVLRVYFYNFFCWDPNIKDFLKD